MNLNSRESIENSPVIIETRHLTKRFQNVVANDDISIDFRRGEIQCLLGENGAGKTTLAECLFGYYQVDSGEIYYKGRKVTLSSPSDAIKLGIGMVHQHFVLIRPFTVIENIALGALKSNALLDLSVTEKKVAQLCKEYGIQLNLQAKISQLSVGEQQWVEILKAVYYGADLLILDEPTASLTPQEVEKLFSVLRQMKKRGLSVIFVTHKLKEVMELSDRVSVLRKGKLVDTVFTSEVTQESLARKMVGRDVVFQISKEALPIGERILEATGLCTHNDRGQEALRGVSFYLHKCEILGVAGIAGNGQRELFEVLTGVRKLESGEIRFNGRSIKNLSPMGIKQQGITHIPEDRLNEGLILDFSVADNLILGRQREQENLKGLFLNRTRILKFAIHLIELFNIVPASPINRTRYLSGGNLQKVILARELDQNIKCLLANQPTRGLDVGVIEYIRQRLLELRKQEVAILLFSEDLDELFSLSDRIAVMFRGKIVKTFNTPEAKLEEVGLCMAGIG
ncbi:MAG TPA: ABC transporter ATP-binding protein [Anaerolineales bacterium]|nr:ABC transporter ATP-binding protein [Anaerolineales bacterium]